MKDDDYFIWLCFLLLLYYYLLYISFFYCEYIYMRIYFIWLCVFLFSNYYLLLERILSTFSTASSVVIHTVNIFFCLRLYRVLFLMMGSKPARVLWTPGIFLASTLTRKTIKSQNLKTK